MLASCERRYGERTSKLLTRKRYDFGYRDRRTVSNEKVAATHLNERDE